MIGLLAQGVLSLEARAEYRAFNLTITNSNTGAQRKVLINLDPIQYRETHGVLPEEVIEIESTWMCYGDTSNKPTCPDPKFPESLPKSDLNLPNQ